MSTQQNKQTVLDFFERFSAGDATNALTYLGEDVIWQSMGIKGDPPVSGKMDKNGIADLIKMVKTAIPKGLELTPVGWTAEGDRVAAEFISYGELTNGRIYNNPYHFLFQFSEGKIVYIKEYMDTLHVKSIFVD